MVRLALRSAVLYCSPKANGCCITVGSSTTLMETEKPAKWWNQEKLEHLEEKLQTWSASIAHKQLYYTLTDVLRRATCALVLLSLVKTVGQAKVDQFDVELRRHLFGQHDVLWLKAHQHSTVNTQARTTSWVVWVVHVSRCTVPSGRSERCCCCAWTSVPPGSASWTEWPLSPGGCLFQQWSQTAHLQKCWEIKINKMREEEQQLFLCFTNFFICISQHLPFKIRVRFVVISCAIE